MVEYERTREPYTTATDREANREQEARITTAGLIADGLVGPPGSPFALPIGLRGGLAGWYMGLPDAQHRELGRVIAPASGSRVVEIGFGPGQLLAMLREQQSDLVLAGVDPSEVMLAMARRRVVGADLHLGTAARMPFPDGHADVALSVNNVPMWPDLDAGLAEVCRVLRPSGVAYLAWHGGGRPRGHQRRLVLSPDRKAALDAAFRQHFATLEARTLERSDLWVARVTSEGTN
jgi:SAM-dependent methyltransferase